MTSQELFVRPLREIVCHQSKSITVTNCETRVLRLAELARYSDDGVQYWLKLVRGPTDDPEHATDGGLKFERLLELALACLLRFEQARVLDGNHGLVGEGTRGDGCVQSWLARRGRPPHRRARQCR